MTPSHFFIFLKGNLLQISSGLEFIIGHFCFNDFGVLEFSRIVFTDFGVLKFSGFVRSVFFCEWDRIEFAVLVDLVYRLSSNFPCLFPFFLLYYGSCALSFLADPVPFLFLFCLCYSNWSSLDSCCKGLGVGCLLSLDLSNVY